MRRKILSVSMALVIIFSLSIAVTGCGKDTSTEKIKVGVALPLSGDSAMYGETAKAGLDFATDEINKNGGIDGKEVELVYQDDQGDSQQASMVAQKLAEEKDLFCVIGHVNSSCTQAGIPIYEKAGLTLLNTSSSAYNLTHSGYSNFFRTCINDNEQGPQMSRFASEELGAKTVSCLVANNDYGNGMMEAIKDSASEYGIKILSSELYTPLQDKDFSVQISKIQQGKPDAILICGDYNEAGLIIKQLYSAGNTADIVCPAGCSNETMIELAGTKAAEGTYIIAIWDPTNPAKNVQEFEEKWEAANDGKVSDERNAYGYEMMYILKTAVEDYGATSETIADVLKGDFEYSGPTGITKFDKNGDVSGKIQTALIIKDGKMISYQGK